MSEPTRPSPILNIRWEDRSALAEVGGDVDLTCSAEFQQDLLELLNGKPAQIVIDLTSVPYMDSSGVASLVKLLSRARKTQTGLRLVGLSERVRSLFEITRLDGVFDIFDTVEDALRP